jgi:hypothetical protein
MEHTCLFILSGNLRNILRAEISSLVWQGFTALYVKKISLLPLVAKGELFARVAPEGEYRTSPNI